MCIPFQICLDEDTQQFNDFTILEYNIIQWQVRRGWFISSETDVNNRTLFGVEMHSVLYSPVMKLFKNIWHVRFSVSTMLFNECEVINIFEAVNTCGNVAVVGRTASLIMARNTTGPNFVPWGAPALMCIHSETLSVNLTHCSQFEIKSLIQETRDESTPICQNFEIAIKWSMWLKALESIIDEIDPGISVCSWSVCRISIRPCEVDTPLMFPNHLGSRFCFNASIVHRAMKCSAIFLEVGS